MVVTHCRRVPIIYPLELYCFSAALTFLKTLASGLSFLFCTCVCVGVLDMHILFTVAGEVSCPLPEGLRGHAQQQRVSFLQRGLNPSGSCRCLT